MRCLPQPLARMVACLVLIAGLVLLAPQAGRAQSILQTLLPEVAASELVEGADGFGPIRADLPVAPVMAGGDTIGWAFVTSDFVSTTGYSGKPIHTLVAVDDAARVVGVQLVKHSEPIVLIGIPESRMKALVAGYRGLDLVAEAQSGGTAHQLEIISGATVTVMVIDDSIVRSGLKVARRLGLGGLAPEAPASGPQYELDPEAPAAEDWMTLEGDGTLRRLSLDVGQVNAAFAAMEDPRAAARALTAAPETTFIEMQAALVSHPAIARSLLGTAEAANLAAWLEPGDHAIALVGRGLYSFKGSGYVRGGIFDRIVLIQDDLSVRFRDRMHRRIGSIAATGAPVFTEADMFRIPADSGFDPTRPFRIQLLVHREVGPIEKVFTTFDLGYQLPSIYMRSVDPAPVPDAVAAVLDQDELAAQQALWRRIWLDKKPEIAGLSAMLLVLTAVFFFQIYATRNERAFFWFRIGFLSVTLVFLGWYANAQLSVVNLMALFGALVSGFSWQAFLLDPLTFILWFSVAAALLFWGRGAYCGWLCPFGALQELLDLRPGASYYSVVAIDDLGNETSRGETLLVDVANAITLEEAKDRGLLKQDETRALGSTIKFALHPMGTDYLGRDMLARLMQGAQVSLFIGIIAPLLFVSFGVAFGSIAGFLGGRIDQLMMRFADFVVALPFLLFMILFKIAFGIGPGESGILPLIIAMAILLWPGTARLVRGQILQVREEAYVNAARLLGARTSYLVWRHMIPNTMGVILVTLTFAVPSAIFTEAFLSFIGMGVAPPTASWGSMSNDGIKTMLTHPHELFFPALMISITVLAFNLLGDGLRDALDAKMRSRE